MATTDHPAARILWLVAAIAAFSSQWATAQTVPPVVQAVAGAPIPEGEAQRLVHESWTFKDGAPGQPTAFAQTTDGYLWVGSEAGLFRFDGERFELFHSPFGDSLRSTDVSTLLAADDGLWVGYIFGGFSFIKKGKVRNFDESTSSVTGFTRDQHGIIWAGSNTRSKPSGLWRFDGATWQRIGAEWNVPNRPVAHLGFDRDGILWVLTGSQAPEAPKELYFLLPGERQFRKAADNLFVLGFTRDADGNVLTTRERSPILKKQSIQFIDRANAIWVISKDITVVRPAPTESLEEAIGKVSPGSSEGIPITPVLYASLVDREGTVWLGAPGAIHRFSHSPLVRVQLPAKPAPWFMLAPDDEGVVWISAGDEVGKSALYRVREGKVDLQRSMAGLSSFVYRAPDKALWFGGEGGLWRIADGRLAKVELPKELAEGSRYFTTMTHDGSGGFWIGGYGLHHLKGGNWTPYHETRDLQSLGSRRPCPVRAVLSMFTDPANRVWLGCWNGQLTVLDADQATNFGPKEGLQVGNVLAINGRGSEVWIGGEFGLQQFDRGRFHSIRAIGDESLRGIVGILETANGDLWLNGLGGIVHIRREEILKSLRDPAYQVSVERLDRRSGLPGLPSQLRHVPTAIEGTDGRLWFAVNNGVVWLDPTRASNQTPPPPVSIQSMTVDNKVYEMDKRPALPAGTSNIQIGYSAVSLLNPDAFRFRYRLRGMEDDWHEAGRSTSVSYRNLAPGSYGFQVEASDANGAWSGKTASTELDILPAYYQTTWFRVLCALMLLLLAWAGYQLRIRRLHLQFEKSLEARVGERTRIARELHDTLLQSFHGLLLRFQAALNHLPDRPGESKQVLASAIDQAAEAITEGRDAVQGLRSSATEANDLADSLRALAEELASENRDEASLLIEVQGMPRALHPIVRDEVFRIAGEALRNAFRHAAANQIELELRYDERQLRVRVRDDGKGIDSGLLQGEEREGHFGLRGMRERAKLAGGKLTVWSGPDEGTEVELSIPAQHAYSTHSRVRSWLARRVSGQSWSSDS